MSVPHIGTQEWINSLNLSTVESWRVWSVNGQTVGWVSKFANLLTIPPPPFFFNLLIRSLNYVLSHTNLQVHKEVDW